MFMKRAMWLGFALGYFVVANVGSASAQLITYQGYVQSVGWQPAKYDGEKAGTTGQSKRLEAFRIWNPSVGGQVCYQVWVQGRANWDGIVCNGSVAGTTGQALGLQGVYLYYNSAPSGYQLAARVHWGGSGWTGVGTGTLFYSYLNGGRIEAIELNIAHGQSLYWES